VEEGDHALRVVTLIQRLIPYKPWLPNIRPRLFRKNTIKKLRELSLSVKRQKEIRILPKNMRNLTL
jgi:hypothetical protein